ncbi:MAG: energy transducer TonB [Bacteroidales bacterium]
MKTNGDSFDDVIFENRNKEYGAYALRTTYGKRGSVALFISIFLSSAISLVLLFRSVLNPQETFPDLVIDNTGTWIELKQEKPETEISIVQPPASKFVSDKIFSKPTFVDSVISENTGLPTNAEISNNGRNNGSDTLIRIIEKPLSENIDNGDDEKIFLPTAIKEQPEFPGGYPALLKFIAKNVKYPGIAQENGIEGTVYIRFVVTRTGEIGNAKILRGIDESLEKEALRVVNSMPAWTPGKNNGTPVNVWFILPVKFMLK